MATARRRRGAIASGAAAIPIARSPTCSSHPRPETGSATSPLRPTPITTPACTAKLRDPNIAILARLLGGVSEPHGELLSYLLFTPQFAGALIEQGERDARVWLERDWGDDGPWLTEPIDVLDES